MATAQSSASAVRILFISGLPVLDCVRAGFAGADAHDLQEVEYENLPVADLPGVGGLLDRFDRALDQVVRQRGLDLHLGQEIDDVLGAAVELRVTFLPAEPLHLGYGDALHTDRGQRLADFVELERLDDGGNELHEGSSCQDVFCTNTVQVALPMLRPASVYPASFALVSEQYAPRFHPPASAHRAPIFPS